MIYPNEYIGILVSVLVLALLFSVFFGYIQTEVFTITYKSEFDIKAICKVDQNSDWKNFKIINFEKYRRTAKVYCIYQDSLKNSVVNLYYAEDKWSVEYFRNLRDNNSFQWPVYY